MDKYNFFIKTKANFKACKKPKRKPDYISLDRYGYISSKYWYNKNGVIRMSNHWSRINIENANNSIFECGKVASCHWTIHGSYDGQCGFCAWNNFKPNLI